MSAEAELSEAKRRLLERMLQGDGAPAGLSPTDAPGRPAPRRVGAEPCPSRAGAPPRVRRARFEDYPQIQRLESTYFLNSLAPGDRRGLFLDNPLWSRVGSDWPIGWVLEDQAGTIVGSLNNVPSLYRFRGKELVCANGHCWAVLDQYRGYAPVLMDEYFSQGGAELWISSKVGADASAIWTAYASRVPAGDWERAAYLITRYRGFARKALELKRIPLAGLLATPAAVALRLRDAVLSRRLPAAAHGVEFAETQGFDACFDLFWQELLRQNPDRLLAVRDRQTLLWHFAVPMRARQLWIFTASRNDLLLAYVVLLQHTRPRGVRSAKLVDYQTLECGHDLLPGLLRVALRRCAAGDDYVLEHHGCGLRKMRVFDATAAYRARKPAWSFYYRAAQPALAAELRDPRVWDPSEFDGDTSYK